MDCNSHKDVPIWVWSGASLPNPEWLAQIQHQQDDSAAITICGTSNQDAAHELDGVRFLTRANPAQALASALQDGTPFYFIAYPLEIPPFALDRLWRASEDNSQFDLVCAHKIAASENRLEAVDALAWANSERRLVADNCPTASIGLFAASSTRYVDRLADQSTWQGGIASMVRAGLRAAKTEGLVVAEATNLTEKSGPKSQELDPRTVSYPSPLASLPTIIEDQFASGGYPGLDGKTVLLHVSHSWGGGVAKWLRDVTENWTEAHHFVLASVSNNQGTVCGIHLELRYGSPNAPVIRRWTLPRAIESCDLDNTDYANILDQVEALVQPDGLIVSSFIGHSLDVLNRRRTTLVVHHDFFPAWPILNVNFSNSEAQFDESALAQALGVSLNQSKGGRGYPDKSAQRWLQLRQQFFSMLKAPHIVRSAPGPWVTDGLSKLAGANQSGVSEFPLALAEKIAPVSPAPYRKHDRLRLLVPGRIGVEKGKQLLLDALPNLGELADIYLLGAGFEGHDFFGLSHVHVLLNYDLHDLPQLVQQIQPHAALMLSTTSETFSYALSEMLALDLPVLATNLGSFAGRLNDKSATLFEPEPAALVAAISNIRETGVIPRMSRAEITQAVPPMEAMISHYADLLNLNENRQPSPPKQRPVAVPDMDRARLECEITRISTVHETDLETIQDLESVIKKRTKWARDLESELFSAQEWAADLQSELDQTNHRFDQLQQEFDERTEWALQLDAEAEILRADVNQLRHDLALYQDKFAQVVNSRSWKMTKPFRFIFRSMRGLLQRLSFQSSRASQLAKRTQRSLKTRGVAATVARIKKEFDVPDNVNTPVVVPEFSQDQAAQPLAFVAHENVLVSIVIPVHNHWHHTFGCLLSLQKASDQTPFEIIVVNDASSDETQQRLDACTGIKVIHNEENLGFLQTCNRGSASARGDYIVFLNNDTAVADQWLEKLLEVFSEYPDAGLVGSKLVYPDGRLQEAGGIVFADGSGWNYGRFEHPDHPAYNFVREVDYCSGASIMIPTALFKELGGFDERYIPAYYEDTDLAFAVREAGKRAYYQPQSVVTHFEGISSGTDTASGTKKYQVINQDKFTEKWSRQLRNQPQPGLDIRVARSHRHGRRALIIDACTPTPDQDSGSVRMINFMRILQDQGFQVCFIADNRQYEGKYTRALQAMGIEVFYHPFVSTPGTWLAEVGASLDLVILSRHYVASNYIKLIRQYCPNARLWFDTVDLHFLREQRLAELENDSKLHEMAKETRRAELAVARAADLTLVVSSVEKQFLANTEPDIPVDIVSNIHTVHGCRQPFSERKDIFFVGGFQHPPNIDSVQFFVQEIFPLVREKLPDIEFHIIGSKAPDYLRELAGNGVHFHGFVEDIEPYLDGCLMAVAPLRYGAGVKGKVNMSMSYGQPVVATPPAIEGMFATDGEDVLVAADANAFAKAVVRLATDEALWNKISHNGLRNVEQHFSFAAASAAVEAALNRP